MRQKKEESDHKPVSTYGLSVWAASALLDRNKIKAVSKMQHRDQKGCLVEGRSLGALGIPTRTVQWLTQDVPRCRSDGKNWPRNT
jgi:hypothetical protein